MFSSFLGDHPPSPPLGSPTTSILNNLIRDQTRNRFHNDRFMHHGSRRSIIWNQLQICIELRFSFGTFLRSIALFDSIISRVRVNQNVLSKLAIVCLALVSKLTESRGQFMKLKRFSGHLMNYCELERFVLQSCAFNLKMITCVDFLSLFFANSDLFECARSGESAPHKNVFDMLTLELQMEVVLDYHSNQFTPLALAIAIIMVVRRRLGLYPLIPDSIRNMTNCTEEILWNLFQSIQKRSALG